MKAKDGMIKLRPCPCGHGAPHIWIATTSPATALTQSQAMRIAAQLQRWALKGAFKKGAVK